MIAWFANNLGTIAVAIVMTAVVAGAVYSVRRGKKRGKTSCGGNCGCCGCGCGTYGRPSK